MAIVTDFITGIWSPPTTKPPLLRPPLPSFVRFLDPPSFFIVVAGSVVGLRLAMYMHGTPNSSSYVSMQTATPSTFVPFLLAVLRIFDVSHRLCHSRVCEPASHRIQYLLVWVPNRTVRLRLVGPGIIILPRWISVSCVANGFVLRPPTLN